MSVILDALAKHGVRGALNTLFCSQLNDGDDSGTVNTRYVSARKKHKSGRKGRASVYRVLDTKTTEDGHQERRYTNVEGPDLDEDQRLGFTGVTKATDYRRGHSVRRTMVQGRQRENSPGRSKTMRKGRSRRRSGVDSESSGKCKLSDMEAREPAPHRRTGGSRTSSSRRPALQDASRVREGLVQRKTNAVRQPQTARPSVFQPPPDRFSQTAAAPAATRRSKLKKNATASKTARLVGDVAAEEAEGERVGEDEESGVFNHPEITEDPFTQPGMTPQESVNLVFGASSLAAQRSDMRGRCVDDRLAPNVHERVSQYGADVRLAASGVPQARSRLPWAETSDAGLEFATGMPVLGHDNQYRQSGCDFCLSDGRSLSERATAQTSHQDAKPLPGPAHVHSGNPIDRFQTMHAPGTPPYTPDKRGMSKN